MTPQNTWFICRISPKMKSPHETKSNHEKLFKKSQPINRQYRLNSALAEHLLSNFGQTLKSLVCILSPRIYTTVFVCMYMYIYMYCI